jgi:hypothetical protein
MPVAEYKDGEWKNSQFGGTDLVVSALENGVKINYTGNGTGRGAYIQLETRSAGGREKGGIQRSKAVSGVSSRLMVL